MDERLHLLGIRHHGPGSAALLLDALDRLDPEAVLIEGHPEAEKLIPYALSPLMRPPVALLSYIVDRPRIAAFSPFAVFSPEWQAMRWALERGRPVRFIDWPVSAALAQEARSAAEPEEGAAPAADKREDADTKTGDPLDLLAEVAGYPDGEAFWNSLIEQRADSSDDPLAVFAAVEIALGAARAYRESVPGSPSRRAERDSLREAYMRMNLRAALRAYGGPLAAVVGAWHLSGLRSGTSESSDKALVAGLEQAKTATLWVPWTNSRLTISSGYGAGVVSPGWYEHLWSLYRRKDGFSAEDFVARWQAKTALTLRQAGYAASTASSLEASRLAVSLAALRGVAVPGLHEMREAALAVFCQGNEAPLAVIEEKLYVGDELGRLDPGIPQTPLASDLEAWQRKTRLSPKSEAEELGLDLRSEAGLLKSTLLHRLRLLGLGWGSLVDAEAGRGTFREIWRLQWQPEFSVVLAEALVYGVTIEQAAAGKARETAERTDSVRELSELVRATLVADLPEAATFAIDCLRKRALDSSDMSALMHAVPPLVQILRYGTARPLPEAELRSLARALCAEINAGMRIAAYGLDESAAAERVAAMAAYHQALVLHADPELSSEWFRQLELLSRDELVVPAVAGLGLRRLHDSGTWTTERTGIAFSWHISGQSPAHSGSFLEAFIGGDAEILLHDRFLLLMIDGWLQELDEDDFLLAIPLLRRGFSGFDGTARRRLFREIFEQRQRQGEGSSDAAVENPAFRAALPLLYRILGVKA